MTDRKENWRNFLLLLSAEGSANLDGHSNVFVVFFFSLRGVKIKVGRKTGVAHRKNRERCWTINSRKVRWPLRCHSLQL